MQDEQRSHRLGFCLPHNEQQTLHEILASCDAYRELKCRTTLQHGDMLGHTESFMIPRDADGIGVELSNCAHLPCVLDQAYKLVRSKTFCVICSVH